MHGTALTALLQLDFIEMCGNPSGEEYFFMLRDVHSGYSWFYLTETTSANTASNALMVWSAKFEVPEHMMSDGRTHLKNETLRLLVKVLRSQHYFMFHYFPS